MGQYDNFANILAAYRPSKKSALQAITSQLLVTFDSVVQDRLTGGKGVD